MVDREVVLRRLNVLERRLQALRRLAARVPAPPDPEADEEAIMERHFQIAIQACIDVAAHVLASKPSPIPDEYAEMFPALARENVLDGSLALRLASAARFRNVLVHGYADIDPARVFANLEHLGDLEAFAEEVKRWLERREQPPVSR